MLPPLQRNLDPLQHMSAIATKFSPTLRAHVFVGRHRSLGTQIPFPFQLSVPMRYLQHVSPRGQLLNGQPTRH